MRYDSSLVDSLSHLWKARAAFRKCEQEGGEFQNGWNEGSPLYQKLPE